MIKRMHVAVNCSDLHKEDSEFESAGEPLDASLCCAPPSAPVKATIEFMPFKKK